MSKGAQFILDAQIDTDSGTLDAVGIDYKSLPKDVKKNDILLLDDGKIVLKVVSHTDTTITTTVINGGTLSNNKGINKKGGGLTAPALTEKDKTDIKIAAELEVDYVAVSFPRDAKDIALARKLLKEAGWENAGIIAKIERVEALENIIEIIEASDGVMVARGDLAVEIGDENVPSAQKMIIQESRRLDKIVITATQMMESMIDAATPTRAEVSDVANAVLDGSDVVMLSAETAAGKYPVETVKMMSKVCVAAEKNEYVSVEKRIGDNDVCERIDEAVARATIYLANHMNAKAIVSLTESGSTPLWMSRLNTRLPIYALTRNKDTQGRMTLYRGVMPLAFDSTRMPKFYVNRSAIDELLKHKLVKDGDWVILTSGDHMGLHGRTNKIKLIQVGFVA